MNLDKYINMENVVIPTEVKDLLSSKGGITKTLFENKDDILLDPKLQKECGYELMDDGSYLVSICVAMPNVTKEMIQWWFWWHASDSKRYQAWYPNEHIGISYHKKDKAYFESETVPPFQQNTQYPIERIGKLVAPLSIEFISPEDFGFSSEYIKNAEYIVCGHVGAFKGLIKNTEMTHIYFKTNEGLMSVSRFWLGKTVSSKFLKKLLVTEKQAKGMAEHCYIEYSNFVNKIPLMYAEWLSENK